eukprot:1749931-Rhodomonas_salina.2
MGVGLGGKVHLGKRGSVCVREKERERKSAREGRRQSVYVGGSEREHVTGGGECARARLRMHLHCSAAATVIACARVRTGCGRRDGT